MANFSSSMQPPSAKKSDINKVKKRKNVIRCRDSRLERKQGKDDSIKQFSFPAFADLLSLHLATFLMFYFNLVPECKLMG